MQYWHCTIAPAKSLFPEMDEFRHAAVRGRVGVPQRTCPRTALGYVGTSPNLSEELASVARFQKEAIRMGN
jgi:hypothetical protein